MPSPDEVRVLAVDLAARFSAAAVIHSALPEQFSVVWQGDSTGCVDEEGRLRAVEWVPGNETRWITQLESVAIRYVLYPFDEYVSCVAVEDLPHHLRFDSTAKHVARIQGRLIDRFDRRGKLEQVRFVQPSLWQRTFEGVWRKGPEGQLEAALKLGYHPPEFGPSLVGRGTGAARQVARKIQTDYVSTFLIGAWACRLLRERGDLDVPNSQPYVPAGSRIGD